MTAIKETLEGTHSFRGVGFIEVNGMLRPVCGSVRINLYQKGTVRYVDKCIVRVPAEEEYVAVIKGYAIAPEVAP